jgi:hypothetical protein
VFELCPLAGFLYPTGTMWGHRKFPSSMTFSKDFWPFALTGFGWILTLFA